MNRVYGLIWNRALRVVQVASELTRASGGGAGDAASTRAAPRAVRQLALACALALTGALVAPSSFAQTVVGTAGGAGADGTALGGGVGGTGHNAGGQGGAAGAGQDGGNSIGCNGYNTGAGGGSPASTSCVGRQRGGNGGPNGSSAVSGASGGGGGAGGGSRVAGFGNAGVGYGYAGAGGAAGADPDTGTAAAGGGGGGGGSFGIQYTAAATNSGAIIGGAGGNGGAGFALGSGGGSGGGGGGGGAGVRMDAATAGTTFTNNGSVTGGAGGNGGVGGVPGADGGGGGGGSAVFVAATNNVVINAGTLQGGVGGASNAVTSPRWGGVPGGDGGNGLSMGDSVTGNVTNQTNGTIAGGTGGTGGGSGGMGIYSPGTLVLQNAGTVQGGAGGASAVAGVNGGTGGVGIALGASGNSTVTNDGSIIGGNGAVAGSGGIGGAGGAGISTLGVLSGATVINNGTISGGLAADGSTRADAIDFTGGGGSFNTLVLGGSAKFIGNVVSTTGFDTLQLGGDANVAGGNVFNVSDLGAVGSAAQFQGFVGFSKAGASTWRLAGNGAASQRWIVNAGELVGDSNSLQGDKLMVASGATLAFDQDFDGVYAGQVAGAGELAKRGAGALVLTGSVMGVAAPFGVVTIDAGTLQVGDADHRVQFEVGSVVDNGTLVLDHVSAGVTSFDTPISGSGEVVVQDFGLDFGAAMTYTGGTTVDGVTLGLSDNGSLAATGALALVDNGVFSLRLWYGGGGTLTVGALSGTAGTRIDLGNASLTFGGDSDSDFAGVFTTSGSVGSVLTKQGTGTVTLDGDGMGYSGVLGGAFDGRTEVAAGKLVVGGSAGNGASLGGDITVDAGAALGGHGTVGGNVTVQNGGHLAPGNSLGTLTVNGNATFAQGSVLDYELGAPGTGTNSFGAGDSVQVGGNLELDGATLNVTNVGGMGPGIYNLFSYGGTLTEQNGGLVFGTTPAGAVLQIQNLTASKQVNLLETATAGSNPVTYWDADGLASATQAGGGSGVWSTSAPNWSEADGSHRGAMAPQPGFAVFAGAPGTVTVDAGSGAVTATGMQFASDGYRMAGAALTLVKDANGNTPIVRVGDGSAAGAQTIATITSVLAGSDGLDKTDLGTLVLTGNATYSGGTTISHGTLQLGDGGTAGSITGNVVDNGTLAFAHSDDVTFSGAISGTGRVVQNGTGTLMLSGANSFTGGLEVAGGTLEGDTQSLTGAITDNAAVAFNQTADGILQGTLTGHGTLTKTGAGALVLNGSNTFTGATNIQAGALVVGDDGHPAASIGGVVTVAKGATLAGTGTVGALDLAGTLNPGGSVGTLHVAGDATFEAGSTYNVEASADGTADQLTVDGSVAIKGGGVMALVQPGNWAPETTYTIVTSGSGVSGKFDSVSDDQAFLTPTLAYAANSVSLTLRRNQAAFPSVATTPNQRGVAAAVEPLGFGNPVFDAVVKLNAADAGVAFDQLSGEYHASQQTARVNDSRYVREAMDQRLRAGRDDPDAAKLGQTHVTAWAHAWGHWGTSDGDGNAAKLAANGDGMLIGADLPVGTGRVGIAGGASRDTLSINGRNAWGKLTSQWLGAFGGVGIHGFALRGGIAYAWDQVPSNRAVVFPGYSERDAANATGHTLTGFIEGAWAFHFARGSVEPFLNLAHARVETGATTETGGAAALQAYASSANVSFSTLGARGQIDLAGHLDLHGELGWQHALGDTTPEQGLRFASGGPAFTAYGVPVAKNAGVGRIGLGWQRGSVAVSADYAGLSGGGAKDQAAKLSVSVRF